MGKGCYCVTLSTAVISSLSLAPSQHPFFNITNVAAIIPGFMSVFKVGRMEGWVVLSIVFFLSQKIKSFPETLRFLFLFHGFLTRTLSLNNLLWVWDNKYLAFGFINRQQWKGSWEMTFELAKEQYLACCLLISGVTETGHFLRIRLLGT